MVRAHLTCDLGVGPQINCRGPRTEPCASSLQGPLWEKVWLLPGSSTQTEPHSLPPPPPSPSVLLGILDDWDCVRTKGTLEHEAEPPAQRWGLGGVALPEPMLTSHTLLHLWALGDLQVSGLCCDMEVVNQQARDKGLFIGVKYAVKPSCHPLARPPPPGLPSGWVAGSYAFCLHISSQAWAATVRSLLDVLPDPASHSCHPGVDAWEVGPPAAVAPAGDPG